MHIFLEITPLLSVIFYRVVDDLGDDWLDW
jgi:hypothetical protein